MANSKTNGKGTNYAICCTLIASTVSILMGYDTGVMSGAMLFIKEELKISEFKVELLAGIINYCALFGSLIAGRLSDYIGRPRTILIAAGILFIGSILMGFAPNYAMLISGRCVAGIGVGFALLIAPIYSAEISPPAHRGFLTTLPEFCISSGILLGYVANTAFASLPLYYGWRLMLGVCAIPAAMLVFGAQFMPESPRWLVLQGRMDAAREVMIKVSDTAEEADRRLQAIKVVVTADLVGENKGKGVWKQMFVHPKPAVKRILVAALGLHFLQHGTGIDAIILYSPRIFEAAGLEGKQNLLYATMAVGATKVLCIIVSMNILDRFGRRPVLLTSVSGMIVFHTTVAFGLHLVGKSEERVHWAVALCICGVLGFMAFYSVGLGPITWVYSSEIYPLRLRAQAGSLGVAVNRLTNATVSMSFISLYHKVTIAGAFFILAGMSVLAWLFFYFLFPETKGKPLEEIEKEFEHGWIRRKRSAERHEGTELGNVTEAKAEDSYVVPTPQSTDFLLHA